MIFAYLEIYAYKPLLFSGRLNVRADALSRRARVHAYSIPSKLFDFICNHFQCSPKIDLFASRLNFKVSNYISQGPDPYAIGFNAFNMPWPDSVYAFPPINLIHRFLSQFLFHNIPFWFNYSSLLASPGIFPYLVRPSH